MKSIKTMLLGIAFLIVASCGAPIWLAGAAIGAIMFCGGLSVGLILCFKGFFSKEK